MPTHPNTRRPLTLVAILISMFMSAMEATVVATAMPTVIAELGGIALYGWVGAIYMLATTVTIPIFGKLSDVLGRKRIILVGYALFLSGSIASGLSGSMIQLIAFRAIQGLGAGALQPMALTIVGDLFSTKERAKFQGIFGAVWGLAGMAGPLLGGLIVKTLSWRWVFFINVPLGITAASVLAFAFHETVTPKKARIDFAGAALLSGSIVSLLLGATRVVPHIMLPLAIVLCAAFVAVERRAEEPLLPIPLLRQKVIANSSILGVILGGVMISTVIYIPLFVQAVLHGTPTQAGTTVAPMLIGWPLASAIGGRLIPRFGFRPLVRIGVAIVTVASLVLAVNLSRGEALWLLRLNMAAFGVGLGLTNTSLIIAVQESVSWEQRGVATATTMFCRTIGGAVMVGALGALLGAIDSAIPADTLNNLLGPAHGRDLSAEVLAQIGVTLEWALHIVMRVIAGVAVVGWVVSLFFPNIPSLDVPSSKRRGLSTQH